MGVVLFRGFQFLRFCHPLDPAFRTRGSGWGTSVAEMARQLDPWRALHII
jgi:hypothetical protein